MPRVRTTKALAKRIDLQYFTHRDLFRKWRLWLSVGLPVIAITWVIVSRVSGSENMYSQGSLSSAHAVLTKNCQSCHVRGSNFRAHVPDTACLGCHDAPVHSQFQTFTPACSSCHVEHSGKPRLAETADTGCTQCHADLQIKPGAPPIDAHVSNFDSHHPEFAALRDGRPDPGTVNFNHFAHFQPTVRKPNGEPAQLVCDDCHRPTNSQQTWRFSVAEIQPASQQPVDVGVADTQQRKRRSIAAGAGAYMTRIRYVNQCAACHTLQYDKLIAQPAPHDQPQVVHAFIMNKYRDYIQAHPEALRSPAQEISAGEDLLFAPEALRPTRTEPTQLASSPAEWVQLRTQAAEELLWSKNCKRCHASTEHEAAGLPQSVKAIILPRWFPRSEFDHEAHRMLACLSCHTKIPNSRQTADVNIPSIALCRQCHKQGGASQLAAEGRCFECHSYHDWRKERQITGIMEMAQPKP